MLALNNWAKGPVQNIVSLTSLLVVKMLTVLVSTTSNSQVAFENAKATHIFSAKILTFMPYLTCLMINLTNNIVSFEQMGPNVFN